MKDNMPTYGITLSAAVADGGVTSVYTVRAGARARITVVMSQSATKRHKRHP